MWPVAWSEFSTLFIKRVINKSLQYHLMLENRIGSLNLVNFEGCLEADLTSFYGCLGKCLNNDNEI